MNIIFMSTVDRERSIVFNFGTIIDQLLKVNLWRIGRKDLIECNDDNSLCLLFYNGKRTKFGDKTPIKKIFLIWE